MGLKCQLCAGNLCSVGDPRARACRLPSWAAPLSLLTLLSLTACGHDSGHDDGSAESTTTTASTASTGVTDPTDPTGTTGDDTGAGMDSGVDTDVPGDVGPNFGLLTFTRYAADAAGAPEQLGMAGAWRTEPFTTDDFYGVRALGLYFPLAPAAADVLALHEPAIYEWGKGSTWVALGNGLRL